MVAWGLYLYMTSYIHLVNISKESELCIYVVIITKQLISYCFKLLLLDNISDSARSCKVLLPTMWLSTDNVLASEIILWLFILDLVYLNETITISYGWGYSRQLPVDGNVCIYGKIIRIYGVISDATHTRTHSSVFACTI